MIKPRLLLLQLMTISYLTGWSVNGAVTLTQSDNACTIRNDFVSVYISKDGEITSLLKYTNNDRDLQVPRATSASRLAAATRTTASASSM